MRNLVFLLLTLLLHENSFAQPCQFDKQSLSFSGTELEQAKCLLRNVQKNGHVASTSADVPVPLINLIGKIPGISSSKLSAYLSAHNIKEAEVGGSVGKLLSATSSGKPAAYFVIHDMSTPEYNASPFPKNIDSSTWSYNSLSFVTTPRAHVYVGRTGTSKTMATFDTPFRATKLELKSVGAASKGRFLHIELLQPRRKKAGDSYNAEAPLPGFTQAQYDRLALLYVCASVRGKKWLVPCYHAALDMGLNDGHDDPQNFVLSEFSGAIERLMQELQ